MENFGDGQLVDTTDLDALSQSSLAAMPATANANEVFNPYLNAPPPPALPTSGDNFGGGGASGDYPVFSPGNPIIHQITAYAESRGHSFTQGGGLVTSSAGAQGKMQVMPSTNRDPGFGITPARNNSEAERIRVGTEYIDKMADRYGGDMQRAWAAYNWGPGNVDKAMAKFGSAWLQHAPAATRAYVHGNMAMLMGQGVPAASPAGAPAASNENFGSGTPVEENMGQGTPVAPAQPQGEGWGDWAMRKVGAAAGAMESGVASAVQGVGEMLDVTNPASTGFVQGPNGEVIPIQGPRETSTAGAELAHRASAPMQRHAQSIMPKNPTLGERAIEGVAGFVPAVGAAIVDPLAGLGFFGAQGMAEAHDEALAKGASEETAQRAGVENAAVSAGLSLVPGEKLVGPIAERVAAPVLRAAEKAGPKTAMAAMRATDAASEMAGTGTIVGGMQFGANVVARENYDPNRPLFENVPTAAAEGALASGAIHGTAEVFRQVTGIGKQSPAEWAVGGARTPPREPAGPGDAGGGAGGMPETDAVWRYGEDGRANASDDLRERAAEAGVVVDADMPHDDVLAKTVEAEASHGEPDNDQANEHEWRATQLLSPNDIAAINGNAGEATGVQPEAGGGARPLFGLGDVHGGTPEAAGERAPHPTGGGEGAAETGGAGEAPLATLPVSGAGFLLDDARRPLTFPTQKDAARYLAANSLSHLFEIANHPDGGFGLEARDDLSDPDLAANKGMWAYDNATPEQQAQMREDARVRRAAKAEAALAERAEPRRFNPDELVRRADGSWGAPETPGLVGAAEAARPYREAVQPDMLGGADVRESLLAARDTLPGVLERAHEEKDDLQLDRAHAELRDGLEKLRRDHSPMRDLHHYIDLDVVGHELYHATIDNPRIVEALGEKLGAGATPPEGAADIRAAAQDFTTRLNGSNANHYSALINGGFMRAVNTHLGSDSFESVPEELRQNKQFMQGWNEGNDWLREQKHTKAIERPAKTAPASKAPKPTKTDLATTRMQNWAGKDINGYDGDANDERGLKGSTKERFLADGKKYLQAVDKLLTADGFTGGTDRRGKPRKTVSINEGGPAVSGDVHYQGYLPDGKGVFVDVGTALGGPDGFSIMARAAHRDLDQFGTKSQNQWLSTKMSAGELAARLREIAEEGRYEEQPHGAAEAARSAKPKPEPVTPEDLDNAANGDFADQEKARESTYGTKNKHFTQDAAEKARQTLRDKLNPNRVNSGFDPEVAQAGLTLMGYHIEAGARSFIDAAHAVAKDLGMRPVDLKGNLRSWYTSARNWFEDNGHDIGGMDDDAAVKTDAGRIEKWGVTAPGEGSNAGANAELPNRIRSGDARPGSEDVPGAAQVGGDGSLPGSEVRAGESPVLATDQGAAHVAQRSVEESLGFGERGGTGVPHADNLSSTGLDAGSGPSQARAVADIKGQDWTITPGSLGEDRSPSQKARDNVDAVALVKKIESEGRPATREEQAVISRYVGWGGLKNVFPDTAGAYGKGFEETGPRLRELLSNEEYETARRSIQYAHYTAEPVVRSMWDIARQLGFKGGAVFEPGMGTGNFRGMMPADIAAASNYNGLEYDHLTASIAKLLYPQSGVAQADYTRTQRMVDAVDLAIGNPPFSETTISSDPNYAAQKFVLHDFFFAKALDAVKPGGLLMFVTSAGTMNKASEKARQWLADRADLVGAIRLPGNAFEKNAGTSVTTDIVILRKRAPGEAPGDQSWIKTATVPLKDREGNTIDGQVNRYFVDHPEMILGEHGMFDKLVAGPRYAVRARAGFDLAAALREAAERLPANIIHQSPALAVSELPDAVDLASGQQKDGSYYVDPDGKLMQFRGGVGKPVRAPGKGVTGGMSAIAQQKVRGLVPVRDALRDVYHADIRVDEAEGAKARERLNTAYDAFVKKYGPVNKTEISYRAPTSVQLESARATAREEARLAGQEWDDGSFNLQPYLDRGASIMEIARERKAAREAALASGREWDEGTFSPEDVPDTVVEKRPNLDPFMEDEESYRLAAIEHYNKETGQAAKGRAFYENAIKRDAKPQINSAHDALLYSLNRLGRPDIGVIADMSGKSEGEILEELGDHLFEVPGKHGVHETAETYLSGNVREKLAEARAAAERNPALARNVRALEAAQPVPLTHSEIAANLGMPWIPPAVVEQFATEHLGLASAKVKYTPLLATWTAAGDSHSSAATSTWGTNRIDAMKLLEAALNRQTPVVRDKHSDGSTTINTVDTQAAQDKMGEIKAAFRDWIWRDEARADELGKLYNDNYNNLVAPKFDGAYLTTPGIAEGWSWRPHQRAVVARIVQAGNTYMAHEVGAGKTSAMIGAGMEMKRLGLVNKPMYVVPNHMLGQFTKEFYEQYPLARIRVADETRFHTSRRKEFVARMAADDLDAVIITHSAFGHIPMSTEYTDGMISEQIWQFEDLLNEIGKDPEQRITRRKIEQQKEQLEQRLSGNIKKNVDQVYTFEQTGVDFLFVDEAHLFRKLDFATKMANVKGIDPSGSQMSYDLFAKSRYLDEQRPNRSLVLASGTPITNTMAELYSVSRYLQQAELENRGLAHFDAWAGAFGDTVTALEQDAAGGYKPVTRFAQFVNVPELSTMVRQVMDVVGAQELRKYVSLPNLKGGERKMVLAEQTPSQEDYQGTLKARMDAIKRRSGPPQKGDDILLSVIGDGRKSAIDYRLIDASAPREAGSKLERMIDEVHARHLEYTKTAFHEPLPNGDGYSAKAVTHGPATQMIFSDFGINGAFPVQKYIRNQLVARGVPANQIAIISDFKTSVAKQRLFNDMNEGKVRVLIGSVAKMGTGVNAQRRLRAIHNMDAQWFPANDTQRNGRGMRQGNMNPEIEIVDYATKGTYDSTMWAMMARKGRFIEGFMRGDPTMRDMEDLGEASQYEQAAAISTSDPRIMELTEWKQSLEKLERRKVAHDRDQQSLKINIASANNNAAEARRIIPLIEQDIAARKLPEGDTFTARAGDQTFDDKAEFGAALMSAMADLVKRAKGRDLREGVGEYAGFPLVAETHPGFAGEPIARIVIKRAGNRETAVAIGTDSRGLVTRLTNAIAGFDRELSGEHAFLANSEKRAADYSANLGKAYDDGGQSDELRTKIHALESVLAAEGRAAETGPTGAAEAAQESRPGERGAVAESRPEGQGQFDAAKAKALADDLRDRLRAMGIPDDVALSIRNSMAEMGGAQGTYWPGRRLIEVALDAQNDHSFVLDHEVVHYLRHQRAISPQDWAILTKAARESPGLWASIERRYANLPGSVKLEEAVADLFAEFQRGDYTPQGPLARALMKIAKVLSAIRNAFRGAGFKTKRTFHEVFGEMASGDMARDADLHVGAAEVARYSRPRDEEPRGPAGIINRMLGRGVDSVGAKMIAKAGEALPDPVTEILGDMQMGVTPMAAGSVRAQATAKDFANAQRLAAYQWGKVDQWLAQTFDPEARRLMWEAADEHGVLLRRGQRPGEHQGLNRLSAKERAAVEELQRRADASFQTAQEFGMVSGEGLESYVPRMIVKMTAAGHTVLSRTSPKQARRGGNLSTTTGQLRQRKYETVEETEAAARASFGEGVQVVRDIRTLALATQRLDQAIAGRIMVNKIKAMSRDAGGGELVSEGATPDPQNYFTLDHPALQKWGPKLIVDHATQRVTPAVDQNGDMQFESKPVWISREFEGPLKAVLSSPASGLTRALMNLKAKMMSIIMYSPLMHNAVIWGKAIPADPIGVLTFKAYLRGNALRKDPELMNEAIGSGMDPVGHRYFNQDIAGIAAAEGLDLTPGRSWTSQVLAAIPGLFSKDAGNAVKAAVDKAGDVWHNTFLWDRIADLQAGLYAHIRDDMLGKGVDRLTAQRVAAHFANRYAGSLPMEAMSKIARNLANVFLFSRSFTLGNLGAFKDMSIGLPSDVRAQIDRDSGPVMRYAAQGAGRQKAIGMLILEVALQYAGLAAAAAMVAWLSGQTYQAPWDNEDGKTDRFLIGYDKGGTAIYGRLPTGKVAEDLTDWASEPRETVLRKLSPYGRTMYEVASNDKGFGRKLYDPNDSTPTGIAKNVGRIAWSFMSGVLPVGQITPAASLITRSAPDQRTAALQATAPFTGVTISHGAPGGPAMADIYAVKDAAKFKQDEAMPGIKKMIQGGDVQGARAQMSQLAVDPKLQNWIVRTTLNPQLRMSRKQVGDFMRAATPEQRAQFAADREAEADRAAVAP